MPCNIPWQLDTIPGYKRNSKPDQKRYFQKPDVVYLLDRASNIRWLLRVKKINHWMNKVSFPKNWGKWNLLFKAKRSRTGVCRCGGQISLRSLEKADKRGNHNNSSKTSAKATRRSQKSPQNNLASKEESNGSTRESIRNQIQKSSIQ